MKVQSKELAAFDKLYAQGVINQQDGTRLYLTASEGPGECVAVNAGTGERFRVWNEPGGTMTICQLNGRGDFLANQRFLPVFDAAACELVWAERVPEGYRIHEVQNIPYLHRFDLLEVAGKKMFIGATLCGGKKYQQDWSQPGAVYVGSVLADPMQGIELRPVLTGLTKNHGLCTTKFDGKRVVLIAAGEGVFVIEPPQNLDGEWTTRQLTGEEASEVAVVDFDGDGKDELVTIEGFHGNKVIVRKEKDGKWENIYTMDIEFGHALWGGKLLGENRVLAGWRRGENKLVCLTCRADGVQVDEIGTGGPSQLTVWEENGEAYILSADRQDGKAVLYTLSE